MFIRNPLYERYCALDYAHQHVDNVLATLPSGSEEAACLREALRLIEDEIGTQGRSWTFRVALWLCGLVNR